MKTLKILGIIGIVVFTLSLLEGMAIVNASSWAYSGFTVLSSLYGLALSIIAVVQSNKIKLN